MAIETEIYFLGQGIISFDGHYCQKSLSTPNSSNVIDLTCLSKVKSL